MIFIVRFYAQKGTERKKTLFVSYSKVFFNHFWMLYLVEKIDFGWPAVF